MDFELSGGGTIYLLRPKTDEAREWTNFNIPDDAQWLGGAVAIEHRYVGDIVEGILADGLTVS
jgi:hypothetical protein